MEKNYLFQIHFENTCIDDDDADDEATAAIDDDDDGGYDGLEICKYLLSKDYKILISPGKNKFYHAFWAKIHVHVSVPYNTIMLVHGFLVKT